MLHNPDIKTKTLLVNYEPLKHSLLIHKTLVMVTWAVSMQLLLDTVIGYPQSDL